MSANKAAAAATTALATTTTEKLVEFTAFGSNEKVSLSVNIVRKWLVTPTKSGKTASDSDVMKFMMLCRARQLNPWEGDAFLVGYDSQNGPSFSLITAHQAFLKRAEAHGQFDGMRSGVIVEDPIKGILEVEGDFVLSGQKLLGGWCEVYRKDHSHPRKARLKLETFDKGFGQWKLNGAGMIVKCAEADALRGSFPNTLGGMYNDAEVDRTTSQESAVDVTVPVPIARISDDQAKTLVELAKANGVIEQFGSILANFGFDLTAKVTVDKYAEVERAIIAAGQSVGQESEDDAIQGIVEPQGDDFSDLNSETESLREYVLEMFNSLSPTQQKEAMRGRPVPSKASHAELEGYKELLEKLTEPS